MTAAAPETPAVTREQRFYEAAVLARSAWSDDPQPAWDALTRQARNGWEWAAGLRHKPEDHCFCHYSPRLLEWSDRLVAWTHTDGYACPATALRPAPATATAAAVMF